MYNISYDIESGITLYYDGSTDLPSQIGENELIYFSVVSDEGTDESSYSYSITNCDYYVDGDGSFGISNAYGDVNIRVTYYNTPIIKTYNIEYSLTKCSRGSSPTTINEGESATITLTADTNHKIINRQAITVNNATLSNWAESGTGYTFTVSNPTGNVVIYAAAEQIAFNITYVDVYQGTTLTSPSPPPTTINKDETISFVYQASSGYRFGYGVEGDYVATRCDSTYTVPQVQNPTTATLTVSNPRGDISVGVRTYITSSTEYNINVTAINCENRYDSATTIQEGGSATIYVIANPNYTLPPQSAVIVNNASIISWEVNGRLGTLIIANPTNEVNISITATQEVPKEDYTVTYVLSACSKVSGVNTIGYNAINNRYTLTFKSNSGFKFPYNEVNKPEVINATVDAYNVTGDELSVTITKITGNVTVKISAVTDVVYTISYTLRNAEYDTSNPSQAYEGGTVSLRVTARAGYVLPTSVNVSGGTLLSWDKSRGVATISNIFDDVVLTVNAIAIASNSALVLYQYGGMPNVVQKTLTEVGTLKGVFRDVASVTHLIVTIEYPKVPDFNYVWVQDFGRYYFVTNFSCYNQNIWEIDLTIDVLMTYQSAIIRQKAFIDRSESHYNPMLPDDEVVVEEGCTFEVITVGNDVFATDGRNWGSVTPNVDTYQPMYVLSASNLIRS